VVIPKQIIFGLPARWHARFLVALLEHWTGQTGNSCLQYEAPLHHHHQITKLSHSINAMK
jgi:hypothetical protein